MGSEGVIKLNNGRMNSKANYSGFYHHAVDGNVVRREKPAATKTLIRPNANRNSAAVYKKSKALKKQRALFVFLSIIAGAVLVALCVILLNSYDIKSGLEIQVGEKEAEYENVLLHNDAREYEINSSVDLNYIISVATDELGMVRSNPSQVVTYSIKNSEYLHQVALIPGK